MKLPFFRNKFGELRKDAYLCAVDMKNRWLQAMRSPGDDGDLQTRLEAFADGFRQRFKKSYPELCDLDDYLFWTLLFSAVHSAGTHAPNVVCAAEQEIRKKFDIQL